MRTGLNTSIKGAIVIVVVSVIAGFIANAVSPTGIPVVAQPVPDDLPMLEFVEVWEAHDEGTAVFIDARTPEEYEDGHIAGALSMPYLDRVDYLNRIDAAVPKDAHIIVYCDGEDCESSIKVAAYLIQNGWTDVSIFKEGFPVWFESGLDITMGTDP